MAGGSGGEAGEPEFQVAPMIDVLLVLLVFFMSITSAQVLKVDKNIALPIAANALKKETQRDEAIVNVRWYPEPVRKAEYKFNDRVYPKLSDLVPALKNARARAEAAGAGTTSLKFRCVIRADREVPALYVSRAMNAAGEAGIDDISFSTVNKD